MGWARFWPIFSRTLGHTEKEATRQLGRLSVTLSRYHPPGNVQFQKNATVVSFIRSKFYYHTYTYVGRYLLESRRGSGGECG
jgi:hypothetical protein